MEYIKEQPKINKIFSINGIHEVKVVKRHLISSNSDINRIEREERCTGNTAIQVFALYNINGHLLGDFPADQFGVSYFIPKTISDAENV